MNLKGKLQEKAGLCARAELGSHSRGVSLLHRSSALLAARWATEEAPPCVGVRQEAGVSTWPPRTVFVLSGQRMGCESEEVSLGWKPGEGSGMDVSSDCVLGRCRPPRAAAPCCSPAPHPGVSPPCLCPASFYSVPPPAAGPRPGRAATRIHATGMHTYSQETSQRPLYARFSSVFAPKEIHLAVASSTHFPTRLVGALPGRRGGQEPPHPILSWRSPKN